MYTIICTWPDISQITSMVSCYIHDPGKDHWQVTKWILRYILGIDYLGFKFERDVYVGRHFIGYVDSN